MRLIDGDALLQEIEESANAVEIQIHLGKCNKDVAKGMLSGLALVRENVLRKPTAYDTEMVVEQLENVLQDLNVIEVIDHIDFDSTIQTSLENFLNAFKSEIMRIVKNNACIDELLKGEEG